MRFADALQPPSGPEPDESHFKLLARDIVATFRRMRMNEHLSEAYLRAHRMDDEAGEQVMIGLSTSDAIASRYLAGQIGLDKAAAEFTLNVPPLMRFLVHEIQFHDGEIRALPPAIEEALHRYYDSKSMENAMILVHACVSDPDIGTHWVFDNLARITHFCDEVQQRKRGLAA